MNKILKITEGEITSAVRRFYRENGFNFLSTLSSGEKLYYNVAENQGTFNKQPDSVMMKEDLVVVCEDKIKYRSLFTSSSNNPNDQQKLLSFLNNNVTRNAFLDKLKQSFPKKNFNIAGCLSSLEPNKTDINYVLNPLLINVRIKVIGDEFQIELNGNKDYAKYFHSPLMILPI